MSWGESNGGWGGDSWGDGGKGKGKGGGGESWGGDGGGKGALKGMLGALMGMMGDGGGKGGGGKGWGKDGGEAGKGGKESWGKGGGWGDDSWGMGKAACNKGGGGWGKALAAGTPVAGGGGAWGKGGTSYAERIGTQQTTKKDAHRGNAVGHVSLPKTYEEDAAGTYGIQGLTDAVTRALEPFRQHEEASGTDMDDFANKMCLAIYKTCKKWFQTDSRHKLNDGTMVKARKLLEEFINLSMEGLSTLCQGKVWFTEIYLSEALTLSAIHCFKVGSGGRFRRTCCTTLITHVNDFVFRFREEERIVNEFYNAARSMGLKPEYEKRCEKHLKVAYEQSFLGADYGKAEASSAELGQIEDFVKAWMTEFQFRGWDVFESGLPNNAIEEKVSAMNTLFHYLTDPEHSCIPHDLLSALEAPPANELRDFITATSTQLFLDAENAAMKAP